jgi:hypothetical protein
MNDPRRMNRMKRIAIALAAASLPSLALAADINLADQLAEGGVPCWSSWACPSSSWRSRWSA